MSVEIFGEEIVYALVILYCLWYTKISIFCLKGEHEVKRNSRIVVKDQDNGMRLVGQ